LDGVSLTLQQEQFSTFENSRCNMQLPCRGGQDPTDETCGLALSSMSCSIRRHLYDPVQHVLVGSSSAPSSAPSSLSVAIHPFSRLLRGSVVGSVSSSFVSSYSSSLLHQRLRPKSGSFVSSFVSLRPASFSAQLRETPSSAFTI
jgi:hypothetical protein